jgi:hypothetical protein
MPNPDKDIASHNQAIKRNPSSKHPWATNPEKSGFVWIHINARKILDQYSKGVGRVSVKTGSPEVQYAFLAPLAITEQAVHNWAEYDSIASRLAQKIRTSAKIGAEFRGLVGSFEDKANVNDKAKALLKSKAPNKAFAVQRLLQGFYNKLSPHSIPKTKVDTPLYYENSNRRSFTFEVILVAEKDPRFDVVEPVKDLMKWSSPALKGGGVNIDFPYMFEVYTRPKEFIRFSTLALTAVQPTYNAPYIGGYPSSCNLQLTFLDLSPLYRSAIESGSVINIIPVGSTAERAALQNFPTTGDELRRRMDLRRGGGSTHTSGKENPENNDDTPVHLRNEIVQDSLDFGD